MKNLTGFSGFGAMLKGQLEEIRNENVKRPIIELAVIQSDYSLVTDSFPVPIPKSDYSVCRSLTIDEAQPLTKTQPAGNHIHEVIVPDTLRKLKPSDRVLVAWVGGNRVVVIDIVQPGEVL